MNVPAFPSPGVVLTEGAAERQQSAYEDMTLRDWFAGQVLAALASKPDTRYESAQDTASELAKLTYTIADAMIRRRGK